MLLDINNQSTAQHGLTYLSPLQSCLQQHNCSTGWSLVIAPQQALAKHDLLEASINPDKVIVIPKPYCSDSFNTAIQAMRSENYGCIVVFENELSVEQQKILQLDAIKYNTALYILEQGEQDRWSH